MSDGEVRRTLVPGETVPRLGVPVHQDGVADRPGVREGVPGERRGHPRRVGELAAGLGRVGGPGRGQLPHRREGCRENLVQREQRRPTVRRSRRPDRRQRGVLLLLLLYPVPITVNNIIYIMRKRTSEMSQNYYYY